jgi:transcriptional regulator with XRE-family HTH domain
MNEKDNLAQIIAVNITYYRKQLNLTQLQLAEKLQYSDKTISKWERAEGVPDIFVLKELSQLFGVSLDSLTATRKVKPRRRDSPHFISYFYAFIVWVIVTIIYGVLSILDLYNDAWRLFIVAIPLSTFIIALFYSFWEKWWFVFGFGTIFMWTLAYSIFMYISHQHNAHMVFIIFIPIYIFVAAIYYYVVKFTKQKKRLTEE